MLFRKVLFGHCPMAVLLLTTMKDYRDKLHDLLESLHKNEGLSRYRIAKQSGISEQTLSNVMHKRRNLSIDALQQLLTSLGYEIEFIKSKSIAEPNAELPLASGTTENPVL
jgi:transcriptional regulator with XRE-family HTH domain